MESLMSLISRDFGLSNQNKKIRFTDTETTLRFVRVLIVSCVKCLSVEWHLSIVVQAEISWYAKKLVRWSWTWSLVCEMFLLTLSHLLRLTVVNPTSIRLPSNWTLSDGWKVLIWVHALVIGFFFDSTYCCTRLAVTINHFVIIWCAYDLLCHWCLMRFILSRYWPLEPTERKRWIEALLLRLV